MWHNTQTIILETPPHWTDYLIAFGTVGAVAAALALAIWGEWFGSLRRKSRWTVDKKLLLHRQGSDLYLRLKLTNEGYISKDVEVYLEEIYDFDGKKISFRPDVLPSPFRWTHYDTTRRNIYKNQPALLDICALQKDRRLRLCCEAIRSFPELADLDHVDSMIKIAAYQDNGQRMEYFIKVKRISDTEVSAEVCDGPPKL